MNPTLARKALDVLENVQGNINPERGYADELSREVSEVADELRAALAAKSVPFCYVRQDFVQQMEVPTSPDDRDWPVRYPHGFPSWVPESVRASYVPLYKEDKK